MGPVSSYSSTPILTVVSGQEENRQQSGLKLTLGNPNTFAQFHPKPPQQLMDERDLQQLSMMAGGMPVHHKTGSDLTQCASRTSEQLKHMDCELASFQDDGGKQADMKY